MARQYKSASAEGLSLEGATALANKIREYWRDQGHKDVAVWTEPMGNLPIETEAGVIHIDHGERKGKLYVVRSNIASLQAARVART